MNKHNDILGWNFQSIFHTTFLNKKNNILHFQLKGVN